LYDIRVHNPGRMPVDDIKIEWNLACPVQRRRGGVLSPPVRQLVLVTPVLPGGGEHRWERRLVMDYAEAEKALPETYADVHFVDVEGHRHCNRWPRSQGRRRDGSE